MDSLHITFAELAPQGAPGILFLILSIFKVVILEPLNALSPISYIVYGILLALVIVFVINTNVVYDFKDISKEKKDEQN